MKTMVIGEVGSNWRSLDDLLRSADFLTRVGAFPKAQAWHTEHLCSKKRDPKQYETLKKYEIPESWYPKLAKAGYFFSVFCCDIIDELENAVHPQFYKIAKPDSTYMPLVEKALDTGKMTIISTDRIIPGATHLHCVSEYPAQSARLGNMRGWHAGISDHTTSLLVPAFAVARGSWIVEKHFKLGRMNTPDDPHSLIPQEFSQMIAYIKEAEKHSEDGPMSAAEALNLERASRASDGLRPIKIIGRKKGRGKRR